MLGTMNRIVVMGNGEMRYNESCVFRLPVRVVQSALRWNAGESFDLRDLCLQRIENF